MSNDERRASDWLDVELDRLAIDGDRPTDPGSAFASETDRALSETARRLHRLDAAQHAAPDPDFLRNLEQRLMPSNDVSQPWSGPPLRSSRQSALPSGASLRDEPLAGRGSSRVSFFATLALVVAIVATTLVVTTWDRNGGTPTEPTSGGFAAVSNDATPAPGDPTPASAAAVTWSIPFPDGTREASTGLMLVENGHVYRQITVETGNEATGFAGVQALRATDGEIAWERWMPWNRAGFAVDASGLYSVAEPTRIVALKPESGEDLWDVILPSPIASMTLRDSTLYVWDSTNTMTAIDTATGESLWSTSTGIDADFQIITTGSPAYSASVIVGEEMVTAIAADGALVAFDRSTGQSAWSVPGFNPIASDTAATDEMVLVLFIPEDELATSSEANPISGRKGVGIDLSTGEIRWSITLSGEISVPVAPGGTGMFHVIADQIVTTESPAEASTPEIDIEVNGSNGLWPEITPNNIYGEQGPDGAEYVYGIDAQTGQIVWQRSSSGSGFGGVYISNSSSESLWALTYDNTVIRLGGETGIILDPPVTIPDPIKRIVVGSLEDGAVAETLGGAIYGFGHVPADEQG